jgi:hypothetical protein
MTKAGALRVGTTGLWITLSAGKVGGSCHFTFHNIEKYPYLAVLKNPSGKVVIQNYVTLASGFDILVTNGGHYTAFASPVDL